MKVGNLFMNILITQYTSYKAICIAKFIKLNYSTFKIIGITQGDKTPALGSKYFDKVYALQDFQATDKLREIIVNEEINILFPIRNSEMDFWLSRKNEFKDILSYWGDEESFKKLNDKLALYTIAQSLGIKTPASYSWVDIPDLKVVVKPRNLSSSRGVKYISNKKEFLSLKNKLNNHSDYIIQEYVEGKGIGYSCFCKDGEIITGYGHKRLAEYPVSGGSSVYRETYNDERLKEITEKLISTANWSGFAMIEFKLTADNKIYLIEVNPRIWGSINQGLQNGTNYFLTLLGAIEVNNNSGKTQIDTYLSPLVYLSFIKYLLHFNFKPVLTFLKNIPFNKADVSLFDDPKGWLSLIAGKIF